MQCKVLQKNVIILQFRLCFIGKIIKFIIHPDFSTGKYVSLTLHCEKNMASAVHYHTAWLYLGQFIYTDQTRFAGFRTHTGGWFKAVFGWDCSCTLGDSIQPD